MFLPRLKCKYARIIQDHIKTEINFLTLNILNVYISGDNIHNFAYKNYYMLNIYNQTSLIKLTLFFVYQMDSLPLSNPIYFHSLLSKYMNFLTDNVPEFHFLLAKINPPLVFLLRNLPT